MLFSFLVTVLLAFGPVLVILFFSPPFQKNYSRFLPLGAALQLTLMALVSTFTYSTLPTGWSQLLVVAGCAAAGVYVLLMALNTSAFDLSRHSLPPKTLGLVLVVAALASVDSAIILGSQGWAAPGNWGIFKEHSVYFSFPFQEYLERNVILVNSLLRHDLSPFLPNSHLHLPLLWVHLAALITSTLSSQNHFAAVAGCTLATGFIFFSCLLWGMFLIRPTLATNRRLAIILFILFFAHADLFNFACSLLVRQLPGIESDGSFIATYFRNTSLKLVTLLSPETTLALMMVFISILLNRYWRSTQRYLQAGIQSVLMLLTLLTAPLLAVLFYPFALISELGLTYWRKKNLNLTALEQVVGLAAAVLLAWMITGHPLSDWLTPLLGGEITFPLMSNLDATAWLQMPMLWIGATGMLGLVLLLIVIDRARRKQLSILLSPLGIFLVAGGLVCHYGISGNEIRYGFSLLCALLATIFVARFFPRPQTMGKNPLLRFGLQLGVMMTLGLHLYFLYAHTQAPSLLTSNVPWQDYFKMNTLIEKKYPHLPIIAATARNQPFPVVMESTVSFASPAQADALGQINPQQLPALLRIRSTADVPSYAAGLGYRAILWGPVEEKRWGKRIKARFVDQSRLLASADSVSLYALTDNLQKLISSRYPHSPDQFQFQFAKSLSEGGWQQEALDHYFEALRLNPKYAQAHNNIGLILANLDRPQEAMAQFSQAIQADPKYQDAYNNLGALLVMGSNFDGAVQVLKQALKLSPSPEVYVNLAHAYASQNRNSEAIATFNLALKRHPEKLTQYQGYIGMGDVYSRDGKLAEARGAYEKSLKLFPQSAVAHVKLANTLVLAGKNQEAIAHYNQALKLDPHNETAQRALASLNTASETAIN